MLVIPPPKSSYDVKPKISIRGTTYKLEYRWNSRTNRWKLDIEDTESGTVLNGVTLIEQTDLTSHFRSKGFDWEGFFLISPNTDTNLPLGRDNFGSEKDYELLFLTYAEM